MAVKKNPFINAEPMLEKPVGNKQPRKCILIICEGENTEVDYFKKFRLANVTVMPYGIRMSTTKLIKEVEKKRKEVEKRKKIKFDEIWVVFDKDENTDFEEAIRLAKSMNYKVAYSNQAFEYWFILHFQDHQGGAMHRSAYAAIINENLQKQKHGVCYDVKSKHVSDVMFEILLRYIQTAYDRACKLYSLKEKNKQETQESVTTVQHLIKSITGIKTTEEKRKEEQKLKSLQKSKTK
ncbi:MAG: RloB domain-containing protein [Bacteroidales bacterium]|nr:RloB domain-containing protein [Bacteroidales bacterium]